ncbi:hypothetical protein HYH02_012612 [Chlamydomonas schloesseri]|uniref:Uncharacterized protein n=1 Tax=Chlamydomonas schloesseri TaxID=2026947 RepID=A0A835SUL6_9CHLO|nr:hypothetical protein HYH02_012612 [Chlamydomonas schloesseri]|eukprot:KAG2433494.1 hypothetical protein HYH02_012612 [Chlamydomonas schloesseri]
MERQGIKRERSPAGLDEAPPPAKRPAPVNHWQLLPTDVQERVASKLDPSDVAGGLKLVDARTAAVLRAYSKVEFRDAEPLPRPAIMAHRSDHKLWAGLTNDQRQRVMRATAASGHLDCVEVALEHCSRSASGGVPMRPSAVLVAAAAAGHVHVCTRLLQAGWDVGDGVLMRVCEAAAAAGHLPVLQLLTGDAYLPAEDAHNQFSVWPLWRASALAACKGGHTHVVAWLHEQCGFPDVLPPAAPAAAAGAAPAAPQQRSQQRHNYRHQNSASVAMELAAVAAAGRHMQLFELMMPALQRVVAARRQEVAGSGRTGVVAAGTLGMEIELLAKVLYGCPMELVERVDGLLRPLLPLPARMTLRALGLLLSHAAASPTPDWSGKLEYVLKRYWAVGVGAEGGQHQQQPPPPQQQQQQQQLPTFETQSMHVGGAAWEPWREMARGGQPGTGSFLQLLQHLAAAGLQGCLGAGAALAAAQEGHADALAWLHRQQAVANIATDRTLLKAAAMAGRCDVLQLLAEHGARLSLGLVILAAKAGRWDTSAPWLLGALPAGGAHRHPQPLWDALFFSCARRGAPLALLRRLHESHGTCVDRPAMVDGKCAKAALDWAEERLAAGARPGLGLDSAVNDYSLNPTLLEDLLLHDI